MRLDAQQKMIAIISGILIMFAFGTMTFIISDKSDDSREITPPVLSTSTLSSDSSSSGWWDSIPTDPSLPTMPGVGVETATVTETPLAAPSQTNPQ